MHRHPDLQGQAHHVLAALEAKCGCVAIAVPDVEAIVASPFRQEIEQQWQNMLGHQLPRPMPPFASFWEVVPDIFRWLTGERVGVVLPRIERDDLDRTWTAPRAVTSWRRGCTWLPHFGAR